MAAASLIGDDPFLYVWGDDLVKSSTSFSKQLVDDYSDHGLPVIGVQEIPTEDIPRYGIVKLREGTREIEDIVEKPSIADAPSRLADFGRMILNSGVVDVLKRTQLGKGNELWIVDAIREYVRSGQKFLVKEVQDGNWLTTGDPLNYLRAVLLYALDRKGIGEELLSFLRGLLMDPVRK